MKPLRETQICISMTILYSKSFGERIQSIFLFGPILETRR